MALTYPLSTLAAVVTAAGISAPTYAEIYQSLQASFQSIYGSDAYIAPDSQDGQMLAVFAKAIFDANNAAIFAYNNYSPSSAQGAGLSNQVKINGIRRLAASNSQADVLIVGQVGTLITNGVIGDQNGAHQWSLPALVTIPIAGEITVTATCNDLGNIEAAVGTLTKIVTPTRGWQTVTNAAEASQGAAVETDAALRRRQVTSTALPSRTVLDGIEGAIANLAGVSESIIYENNSSDFDANGLPPHSIAAVVLGGDASAIANILYIKKTPGAYTYGDVVVPITNDLGIVTDIRFFVPTSVPIQVAITVKALAGYTSAVGVQIKQAIADYINALLIGEDVDIGRLYLPAQLYGGTGVTTFQVNAIEIAAIPAAVAPVDVAVAFNARATCDTANIAITVV